MNENLAITIILIGLGFFITFGVLLGAPHCNYSSYLKDYKEFKMRYPDSEYGDPLKYWEKNHGNNSK